MANHLGRLYALALALLVLFVTWMAIAARPWRSESTAEPSEDPRLVALAERERRLQREALVVRQTVKQRWAEYRQAFKKREREIVEAERRHEEALAAARLDAERARISARAAAAPTPAVRVVTLPPLTITRSS